jgi:hypothetical protein
MELGFDAVLLNTAVAGAAIPWPWPLPSPTPSKRARQAFGAGMLEPRDMAVPSTPVIGKGGVFMKLDPFYLIVDSTDWIERLVPLGVKLVQLRIKDCTDGRTARRNPYGEGGLRNASTASSSSTTTGASPSTEDATSSISARRIWPPPILPAIRAAGLKLGLSTHDDAEVGNGAQGRSPIMSRSGRSIRPS